MTQADRIAIVAGLVGLLAAFVFGVCMTWDFYTSGCMASAVNMAWISFSLLCLMFVLIPEARRTIVR